MESKQISNDAAHIEAVTSLDEKMISPQMSVLAAEGALKEHSLSPMAAVRAYPMAIFWSLMVSMCVVMEGYDTDVSR
jgi:SP family general alpha glucoside:H+ symporter-like MFS transporter